MKRRKFIYHSLIGLTIPVSGGLYSWMIEPFWIEVVNKRMPLKNLPLALEGARLMQISDIHLGERFPQQYLYKAMEKARTLNPDIVVYTGDFISYESDKQLDDFKAFSKSLVKGNKASLAILGKHDYGVGWAQEEVAAKIVNILENVGITVLRNEIYDLEGLKIIGLDDFWAPNFYPEEVMNLVEMKSDSIVLVHNPDVCDLPIWDQFNGWILSGHTHGGQVKPPFLPPPMLPVKNRRYTSGEIDLEGNRKLYINRALGHLWQVRLNVRPEITLFELTT